MDFRKLTEELTESQLEVAKCLKDQSYFNNVSCFQWVVELRDLSEFLVDDKNVQYEKRFARLFCIHLAGLFAIGDHNKKLQKYLQGISPDKFQEIKHIVDDGDANGKIIYGGYASFFTLDSLIDRIKNLFDADELVWLENQRHSCAHPILDKYDRYYLGVTSPAKKFAKKEAINCLGINTTPEEAENSIKRVLLNPNNMDNEYISETKIARNFALRISGYLQAVIKVMKADIEGIPALSIKE